MCKNIAHCAMIQEEASKDRVVQVMEKRLFIQNYHKLIFSFLYIVPDHKYMYHIIHFCTKLKLLIEMYVPTYLPNYF